MFPEERFQFALWACILNAIKLDQQTDGWQKETKGKKWHQSWENK